MSYDRNIDRLRLKRYYQKRFCTLAYTASLANSCTKPKATITRLVFQYTAILHYMHETGSKFLLAGKKLLTAKVNFISSMSM
jgi:uncharacterized protein YtpQ (UPF0354 family)